MTAAAVGFLSCGCRAGSRGEEARPRGGVLRGSEVAGTGTLLLLLLFLCHSYLGLFFPPVSVCPQRTHVAAYEFSPFQSDTKQNGNLVLLALAVSAAVPRVTAVRSGPRRPYGLVPVAPGGDLPFS